MNDLKILCMYYKDKIVDTNNKPFINIQCGKEYTEIDLNMIPDNTGENISEQNPYWSEITGLYWAWKNIGYTKYIGLCSYRRFFNYIDTPKPLEIVSKNKSQARLNQLDHSQVNEILNDNDIILPVSYTYPWSIRRVCSMNYNDEDFDNLENIIKNEYHDYYPAYIDVMYKSNKAIGHNMFIMKWDDFNNYCAWVFEILFKLQSKVNPKNYPVNMIRVFGYIHEILLAVYVKKNKMKIKNSQILWIDNIFKKSRFNNYLYHLISFCIFKISKILGDNYPHKITKKKDLYKDK